MADIHDPQLQREFFALLSKGIAQDETPHTISRILRVSFHLKGADLLSGMIRIQDDLDPVNLDDPIAVKGEFWAIVPLDVNVHYEPTPEQKAQARVMAKRAANLRRLKNGEITREEFEEIMREDDKGSSR